MSDNTHLISPFCPRFHHAVELVGRRWSGAILRALMSGATRFSDIQAAVPGLSDRLVSERLKELDAEGIVERIVIPETPVRIEYRLTEKGLALLPAIEALSEWAENWLEGIPDTGHNSASEDVATTSVASFTGEPDARER